MSNNGYSSKKNLEPNFDDDLSDLFGELGDFGGDDSEPSGSLDEELSDLFGTEFKEQTAPTPPTETSFDELFGDRKGQASQSMFDESVEEMMEPTSFDDLFSGSDAAVKAEKIDMDFARMTITPEVGPPASEAELESELDSIFGENNDVFAEMPEATEDLTVTNRREHESEDVVAGLENIFASSPNMQSGQELEADLDQYFSSRSTVPPGVIPAVAAVDEPKSPAPSVETTSTPAKKAIAFFPTFDALQSLIEEPAQHTTVDWQSLDNLLCVTAGSTSPAPAIAPKALTEKELENAKETNFDDLVALLEEADIQMGGAPTVPRTNQQPSRTPNANAFEQTMRIPVKQLDNLSNLMGELVVNRNSLEQGQEKLRQFLDSLVGQVQRLSDIGGRMQDLYERSLLERSLLASRGQASDRNVASNRSSMNIDSQSTFSNSHDQDYDPLEMDQFTGFHLLSQEMIELIVRVRESSSDIEFLVDDTEQVARNLRQVSTQLQEGLTKSRMIPFSQAVDRLVRPVRDISRKLNKKAALDVEGRETLIDKMILEQLYDPLTHLINNAITHGIERPEIRLQSGKPATGKISLKTFIQGNQIVISIADDGAGIDPDVLVRKALEKGIVKASEVRAMAQNEIYDFIFHPGFSTKDQADDFSGRGVGMDVVRTALGSIRGSITIDSAIGRGTTFIIRLPLTLNICKALCCINRHSRVALPMDGVEDMQDLTINQLEVEDGKQYINWRGSRLRLHAMNSLLTHQRRISRGSVYGSTNDPDQISIVVLRSAGNLLALQVDQVIGEQEIVIKQLEGPIPKPAGISGATVLGDGTIMPVADILELIELAAQGRVRSKVKTWQESLPPMMEMPAFDEEPTVLIIDDSITVRELLSISFTKAGYRVEQARDGQEAWDMLRGGLPCDLVFCDIEMPRIDGLELLSRIQKDEELAKIPVAMLTSRGAERHRQMAAQLGASAYFTKPYLEEALLDAALKMRQGEVLLPGSVRKAQVKQETKKEPVLPTPPPETHSVDFGQRSPGHFATQTTFKALIIDDSVTVRELLAMTFKNAGYIVEKARDGQDALDKLLATPDFHVAFCDIEMPRIDGLELLNRVREHESLHHIPIAMLTSRGAERHRKIAAERGAKAYFTKPYMEDNLLQAAKRLIQGEVLLDEDGTLLT